jgi:DNA-binding transcriptional ArsR family regulator
LSANATVDDSVLRAANSPRRRRILQLVWDGELSSQQIAAHLADITWQAVSLNIKVLKEAGLVTERREGTRRFYRVDRDRCAPLESILRAMWQRDLARLADVMKDERKRRSR